MDKTVEEIIITETTDRSYAFPTKSVDVVVHNPFGKAGVIDQIRRYMGDYIDSDGVLHKKYEVTTYSGTQNPIVVDLDYKQLSGITNYYSSASAGSWVSAEGENDLKKPRMQTNEMEVMPQQRTSLSPQSATVRDINQRDNIEKPLETRGRHAISPHFRDFLSRTKIKEVAVMGKNVMICKETDSLLTVYQYLINNRILSLPVCSSNLKLFYGFIDIVDIVTYIAANLTAPRSNNLVQPWYAINEIANVKCGVVGNFSQRNPTMIVDANESVQNVIDDIAFDNYHRIALMEDGFIAGVASQSNLLEFFYRHNMWENMGVLSWQTVSNLKLGLRDVRSVTPDVIVMDALKLLVQYRVSALAVIDVDRNLFGNLSASDLKNIGYDMELYPKLFGTVGDFIRPQLQSAFPVTVTLSTKFRDVLALFDKKKVHRLYVTSDESAKNIVGVITPGDILKCFQSPHLAAWIDKQFSQT